MKTTLLTFLCWALPALVAAEPLQPGTNQVTLENDGLQRQMLIQLPQDYDSGKRYPVIFGFHGAGGPMQGYNRKLAPLVDREGIISVSPQGDSNAAGTTGWNAFPRSRITSTDDVGLVRKIVEYLEENASIDADRIYATGGSSGAIFCYRLALETDIFAAIAPFRGGMITRLPIPRNRPKIPILHVMGTEDKLYRGGEQAPGEIFHSARQTLALWAENHGVTTEPEVIDTSNGVTLTRFSPEGAPFELLLYAVEGKGHRLGREVETRAAAFMWEFFK